MWSFAAPWVTDSSGDPEAMSTDVDVSLVEAADGWLLTVTPDPEWLAAPERAWPVLLDPTLDVGADGDCYLESADVNAPAPARRRRC